VIKIIDKRDIVNILIMFVIVQVVGLLLVYAVDFTQNLPMVKEAITSPHSVYLSYALDAVLVATVVLLFLNRHGRSSRMVNSVFFKVLEAVVVISTSVFFFISLFHIFLPESLDSYIVIVSVGAAVILIAVKDTHRSFRNMTTMVSGIGVGIFVGLFADFKISLIILAMVAAYDYIAVFITKSMLKLAGIIEDEDLSLVISSSHLDVVPESDYPSKQVKGYLNYLHSIKKDKDPRVRRIISMGELPVISQVELGEGDLGLPLMAIVSAYLTFNNLIVPVGILAGATAGLLAAICILCRCRRALPAIPPLFFFIFMAATASLLISGQLQPLYEFMAEIGALAVVIFALSLQYAISHLRKCHAEEKKKTKHARRSKK